MKQHLLTTLCLAACSSLQIGYAQQIQVAGKVSDNSGNPVSGVTISVKGSSTATSTNSSGLFTISTAQNAVLVVSAVGYSAQEIPLQGRKTLNITLSGSESALDEVIVVAYGTAKKSSYTGSAANINYAKEAADVPVTSFEQALVGKMPGVQVNTTSGQAGSTSSIRVRGVGSMLASNEPLYVVDGVPITSGDVGQMGSEIMTSNNIMSSINPSDIESITVLKDAAASSLYGSRAANGVVIITTKKGSSGKSKIDFRTSIGLTPDWATDNYKPGDPQQQIQYFYQIFHDYRTSNGFTEEQANTYALNRMKTRFGIHGYDFTTDGTGLYATVNITGKTDGVENRDGKYFDWNKALFRTGVFQTNDLSASGGNDKTTYFSSLSYTKDKGRAYTNEYDRIGGRLNVSQKLSDRVTFDANINLSSNDKSGYNDTRNTGTNYFYLANNLLFPFYWPTDYLTGAEYTKRYNSLGYNPLYYDKQWENTSKTLRIVASPTLTVRILPELTAKTIFSFDNAEVKDHLYFSPLHYNALPPINGSVMEYATTYRKLVSSSTLTYHKTIEKHTIDVLAGWEAEKNNTDYQYASGSNLPSSSLHTVITAGVKDADAYYWGNTLLSFLSKAEYNYDQKYLASASFRRDGASRLGPDTRWGNFWSVAGSWNLKSEDFLASNETFSALRLKVSYGTNGTLPPTNFAWRSLAAYGYNYMNNPGGQIVSISDKNLRWEKSYSFNAGTEFGLFKNRITGSIDYFNRDAKDLLQDVNISLITGMSSTTRNVGQINNKGLEVGLAGDILRHENFTWSANANASFIKSTVTSLYGGQDISWTDPTGDDARVNFIYREGENTYAYYLPEWAGVDKTNGKPIWYTNDGTEGEFLHNGRGASNSVSDAKPIIAGSPLPKVYGGFGTAFEYKAVTLGFNFNYKIGGKLFDFGSRDVAEDGYYWERVRSYYGIENVWSPTNTDALYPKVSGNDPEDGITRSTRHLYDASFLRLKNVNLSYRIPKTALSRIGLSQARIYFNGTNLLTFSKFKWADPEVNEYGTRGWETPFGKTYTFGIEISL